MWLWLVHDNMFITWRSQLALQRRSPDLTRVLQKSFSMVNSCVLELHSFYFDQRHFTGFFCKSPKDFRFVNTAFRCIQDFGLWISFCSPLRSCKRHWGLLIFLDLVPSCAVIDCEIRKHPAGVHCRVIEGLPCQRRHLRHSDRDGVMRRFFIHDHFRSLNWRSM